MKINELVEMAPLKVSLLDVEVKLQYATENKSYFLLEYSSIITIIPILIPKSEVNNFKHPNEIIVQMIESSVKLNLYNYIVREVKCFEKMDFTKVIEDECLEFMVKTGIVDKNGKLTERYK